MFVRRHLNHILAAALTFHASCAPSAERSEARVSVDAAKVVRTVDARWFGVNTAIWDRLLDTPETVAIMRELDVQALRFPGGSLSDQYHWASNTDVQKRRIWPTSFSNFIHVATNIHAQVFITVNYGSGTAEEAAAWVRHANVTNHFGIKYWEIGNENYGFWEYDENSPKHDPITYATRAREYFRQMKAADPSIKVGVVATDGYNDWTRKMLTKLKELGVTPDFVIHHLYPQSPGSENDARLLQSSSRWASDAEKFRATLKSIYGAAHTNIELVCTENNSVSEKMGKQTTSLVNGLYLADSFGQMAQTEFNAFLWWDFRNMQEPVRTNGVSLYGWRPYGDHGMLSGHDTRYPHFYTFKLLKYFARGGDQIVRATSDNKLLAVYAAHRTNGALTLLIINKSPSATLTANFSLHNFEPASRAALFSYGIPQVEAARTGKGSQDIAETEIDGLRATFSHEFPPYSVSVIVLRK